MPNHSINVVYLEYPDIIVCSRDPRLASVFPRKVLRERGGFLNESIF